jgi:hypothetical protein
MKNWKILSTLTFLTLLLGIFSCEDTTKPDSEYTVTVSGQVVRLNNTGLDSVVITMNNPFRRDTVNSDGTFQYSFLTSETEDVTATLTFRHINLTYFDTTADILYGPTKKTIGVGEVRMRGSSSALDSIITGKPSSRPGQIAFISSSSSLISIRGAGSKDATTLTFEVRDSLGIAVDKSNKTAVFFAIVTKPDLLTELNKVSDSTNSQGRVSVQLTAGQKSGLAQVQAIAAVKRTADTTKIDTIKSPIISVTIAGGNPVPSRFTIGTDRTNVPGLVLYNQKLAITAVVGDTFGNPVQPGTLVYFTTNGGIIQPQGETTVEGTVSVSLTTGNPAPPNGFATITAQVGTPGAAVIKKGGENRSATIVDGDLMVKQIRPKQSAKQKSLTAKHVGTNNTSSIPVFSRSITVLFSGAPIISSNDTNFVVPALGSKSIQFTVADLNGNPLSQGTSIRVSGIGIDTTGAELTGDLAFTLPDTYDRSFTNFNVNVRDRRTKNLNLTIPISLSVEVTGPNGNVKRTIRGYLVSSVSDSGKVSSMTLVNPAMDSIYVNGGGIPNSIPVQVKVLDASNNPSPNVPVDFSIVKSVNGGEYLTQSIAVTDINGIATAVFKSGIKSGLVQIVGSIKRDSISISTANKNIYIRTGKLTSLNLMSVSKTDLSVKGSGNETATLIFEGRDSLGNAIDGSNQTNVTYSLFGDTVGASISPSSVMTDPNNGRTTTTFTSGTMAGLVQLTAHSGSISSAPVQFTISGGLPSQSQFTVLMDKQNYSALTEKTANVTVISGDKYGNPARPGTPIFFTTNGGLINSNSTLGNTGQTTAQLQFTNPVPPAGIATVTARAIGEGNTIVKDSVIIVLSQQAVITEIGGPYDNFEIEDGLSKTFQFRVADANNNPLAKDNNIVVTAEGLGATNIVLSGDINVTTRDTKLTGVGTTVFSFTARDNVKDEGQGPKSLSFKITVTGPNTIDPLTHVIDGTLKGGTGTGNEGSVASVEYVRSSNDTIFVANAGIPTTDTIKFKVRNLKQQPVSGAAVQFFFEQSLNTSEFLSPSYAVSNDSGEVTVVAHAGIKAGVLGVQATVTAGNSVISSSTVPIYVKTGPLASISLVSVDRSEISVKSVGGEENATIVYEARDLLGNPLDFPNQTRLFFNLVGVSGFDEDVNPDSAMTNPFTGRASVTVNGGTRSTVLQVIARNASGTIKSSPVPIVVHGGFVVDSLFLFLPPIKKNISLYDSPQQISMQLGDRYGNPPKPGTAVYFETNAGIISAAAFSDNSGIVSATFSPVPQLIYQGLRTITASTVGNTADGLLQKSISVLMSGDPKITVTNVPTDTVTIFDGASANVQFEIVDSLLGNPISSGHTYAVTVEGSVAGQLLLSGDVNGTLPDTQDKINAIKFSFNVSDATPNAGTGGNFKIKITINGVTGTTIRTINGKLFAPSNIVVPPSARVAASIALISTSTNEISISGVGGTENSTLTYEVRDSVGVPITIDNRVIVNFQSNFFPNSFTSGGTAPTILPTLDSTDENGKARVSIFSGTQAGAVQLEAVITLTNPVRTIKSQPVKISINAGFADQRHFTISTPIRNFPGLDRAFSPTLTATVGVTDKYSNPVLAGTQVYFHSTHGTMTPGGVTDALGFTSGTLLPANPYPINADTLTGYGPGYGKIYAQTLGEDGAFITDSVLVLWTGAPVITNTGGSSFTVANGGTSGAFTFKVVDKLGHPLSAGTTINVSSTVGVVTGAVSTTLYDTFSTGEGITTFTVFIKDAVTTDVDPPADGQIIVSVAHPVYGTYTMVLASGTVD